MFGKISFVCLMLAMQVKDVRYTESKFLDQRSEKSYKFDVSKKFDTKLTVFCPLRVELLSDRQFPLVGILAAILVAMLCDSVKSVIIKSLNKFFISIAFTVVFKLDPFSRITSS